MGESPMVALRAEYDAIAERLDAAGASADRETVKRDIIAFFKRVDGLLGEMGQLKEEIRVLVDKYKEMQAASTGEAAPAPEFTGARPAIKADHIGASTFIEKGWSLISLGDHAGAIQALQKALQLSPGETQAESLLGWAQMLHGEYDDALIDLPEGADARARQLAGPHQRRVHLPQETHLRRSDRASLEGDPARQRQEGHAVRALLSRAGLSASARCTRTRRRSSRRRSSSGRT